MRIFKRARRSAALLLFSLQRVRCAVCGQYDGYDTYIQPLTNVNAYYSVIPVNGVNIFTAKVVLVGNGWIGWGTHATNAMVGTRAVIGKPFVPSVGLYDLQAKAAGSVVLFSDQSPLLASTLTQTGGNTTLTYNRTLDSVLAINVTGYHMFSYRIDTQFLYHNARIAMSIIPNICVEPTPAPTIAGPTTTIAPTNPQTSSPTSSPTASPTQPAACGLYDGFDNFIQPLTNVKAYYSVIPVNGVNIFTAKIVLTGNGWIGWGTHDTNAMIGTRAIIGKPFDPSVGLYDMQAMSPDKIVLYSDQSPLLASTITQAGGITTLKFNRTLDSVLAVGVSAYHLFAYKIDTQFLYHDDRIYVSITPNICTSTSTPSPTPTSAAGPSGGNTGGAGLSHIQAHALVMTITWVFLAPLGICAPLFLRKWKHWIKVHKTCQVTTLGLTALGVYMGIHMVPKGYRLMHRHGRLGVLILAAVFLQVTLAAFRPHPPSSGERKKGIRRIWELQHRFLALLLLSAAYYNMWLGIGWASFFGEVDIKMRTALCVAVAITIFVFLIGGFMKLKKSAPTLLGPD